ncbi:hypothetical protein BC941DRAFT_472769 [Chlamydoabsidia padenii]|nr:hypothetical protein BC941DRAFT_472769 [Chlamydoabsidia padenii]
MYYSVPGITCTEIFLINLEWCFLFQFNKGRWMEINLKTTNILGKSAATKSKTNVMLASMLNTIEPKDVLVANPIKSGRDTYTHYCLLCYQMPASGQVPAFGSSIFDSQKLLANDRLNQADEQYPGKFKRDYVAYTQVRSNFSNIRILALHCIFPFMLKKTDSITKYLGNYDQVMKELKPLLLKYLHPPTVYSKVSRFDVLPTSNVVQGQK